ncbi:MAG: PAS domain-containing protein [Beijerinckiaceae bacterium]
MAATKVRKFAVHIHFVPARDRQRLIQQAHWSGCVDMRHDGSRALYEHWQGLCRGGMIPDRNDLEPSEIGHLLQDVFILGADFDGSWNYRVAGTRLSAFAGRELREEPFERWWRATDRVDAARMVSSVAQDASPLIAGVSAEGLDSKNYDCELVLLPLRHGGRNRLRLLGGLFPTAVTASKIGLRVEELGLLSIRMLDSNSKTIPAKTSSVFGKPATNISGLLERRRSFRLIDGGKSL